MAGDTQCFDVTILSDVLVEGVEDFFLNVASVSPLVTVDPGANQATVNIVDPDSKFSFLSQISSIDEAISCRGHICAGHEFIHYNGRSRFTDSVCSFTEWGLGRKCRRHC